MTKDGTLRRMRLQKRPKIVAVAATAKKAILGHAKALQPMQQKTGKSGENNFQDPQKIFNMGVDTGRLSVKLSVRLKHGLNVSL